MIRRALGESAEPLRRAALLPAVVQIMLVADEANDALQASHELADIAARQGNDVLHTMAAEAKGDVALAAGDAWAALVDLRRAASGWLELHAIYETARPRADRTRLPGPWGRGNSRARNRSGRGHLRGVGRRPGSRPRPVAPGGTPEPPTHTASRRVSSRCFVSSRREEQQRDRRRTRPQREDGRSARKQHLHEAARAISNCCDGLRIRARPRLTACWVETPTAVTAQVSCISKCTILFIRLTSPA